MLELEELEKKAGNDPGDNEKQYELALAYIGAGRYSEAVGVLDGLLKKDFRNVNVLYSRGVVHMSTGNYRQAGQDFLRSVALDRDFLHAYKNLGFVQLTMGKEAAAVGTLERVLDIDPSYVDAYCLLGDVYIDMGEYGKARAAIEKALELEPDGAEPHCKMAMYCLSQGDFKGLKEQHLILKELDPSLALQIGGLFFDET
ncbi:tetratricopeptide repeat protein [Prosthecochloris sp.]|uniref:tetratricopeptide repeat protein n=1 Tax=Prosthecochloris sp. TaxID=290513 RepID=UPI0025DFAE1B|nr:tetratricopeptide repeat protein [Prosthecochloris sp.]